MKPLNLLALLLFLAGSVWVLTLSDRAVRKIQQAYYSGISPFIKGGSELELTARGFVEEVHHSEDLEKELDRVELDYGRLLTIESQFRELEKENRDLRAALEFKQRSTFDAVPARVIKRQPATWLQSVTIDRGSRSRIGAQVPVLANGGLAGKIDKVPPDDDIATVLLLTDESCQVSVQVDGTPEVGILSGQRGRYGEVPLLILRYLSRDAPVQPGMKVLTTGKGGLFPADVLVGTIESFEPTAFYGEARVRPSVDFVNLNIVFVITDREIEGGGDDDSAPLPTPRGARERAMIGYFVSLVALIVTACIAQQFVPVIVTLYEARVLLLPLVFLCCAVTISPSAMVPLAFLSGLLWDAQHYSPPVEPDNVYPNPVEALRFGYSVVLYGAMGFFMQGIQPLFREGKWHVSALLSGAAIFLYLSAEYLLITFVRGEIIVTKGLALKIAITSLLTMLFSPVVFWMLFQLARLFRYTIRYEGFRKYRRQVRGQLQTP